jgi:flagellar hook-associated protein 1 FlgK
MSTFSTLEVGKRGLIAQKFGIDVTSNNITNVNTAGYSRRSALTSETDPVNTLGGYVGTGSEVDKLRTYREEFFDKEIRKSYGLQSGYESDKTILEKIEAIVAEPSDDGLDETVQNFLHSFEDINVNAQDPNMRATTVQAAITMVDRFHSTAEKLDSARQDVFRDLKTNVDKMNQYINDVVEYNKKIGNTKASAGIESQTYVDQRENILEEMSKLAGVSVTQTDNGQVNVFVNGMSVVTGSVASKLELQETVNSTTGERTAVIAKIDANKKTTAILNPVSGEMASEMKMYNSMLDPIDSSSDYSVYTKLNSYVETIATKVNDLCAGGYGLKDTGTTPPGRAFFTSSDGKYSAADIAINKDILADGRNIPVSDTQGASGNNKIGMKIARLASDTKFIDNMTHAEYYAGVLGKVGSMSADAIQGKKTTDLIVTQLESQRSAVIGVDTDEEAVSLIKFQRAFEASSRVVNTVNEMLTTLINLGK